MSCSVIVLSSSDPCAKCGSSPSLVLQVTRDGATGYSPALCGACAQMANTIDFPPVQPGACSRTRKAVRRQENHLAEMIGGRRQPGSGNKPWEHGDAYASGSYVAEAKLTVRKQYTVRLDTLAKLRGECGQGEKPLLHLQFIEPSGCILDSWVLIPEEDWRKHAAAAVGRPADS